MNECPFVDPVAGPCIKAAPHVCNFVDPDTGARCVPEAPVALRKHPSCGGVPHCSLVHLCSHMRLVPLEQFKVSADAMPGAVDYFTSTFDGIIIRPIREATNDQEA